MTCPDLSVVIPSYRNRSLLLRCLASLDRTKRDVPVEVIVVDNASGDDTPEAVTRHFPHVRLLCNEANKGFAAAVNQGVAVARGPLVLLLNNDVVVLPGALVEIRRCFDADPDLGILGGRLLHPDGRLQPSVGRFPTLVSTVTGLMRSPAARKHVSRGYDSYHDVDWVSGACMAVRRSVFQELGGLDERFFMYYEDTDLCLRARQHGHRVCFTPHARVIHFHPSVSQKQIPLHTFLAVRQSFIHYFTEHSPWMPRWLLSKGSRLWLLLGVLIRLVPLFVSDAGRENAIRLRRRVGRLL